MDIIDTANFFNNKSKLIPKRRVLLHLIRMYFCLITKTPKVQYLHFKEKSNLFNSSNYNKLVLLYEFFHKLKIFVK